MTLLEVLVQLLRRLPGRTTAVGLESGFLTLTLRLAPGALAELEPVLRAGSNYSPYVPPPPATVETLVNAHVLIVEDALVARMLLRRMLEQLPGCRITEAASGVEALALLQQGPLPDLCISDISMPDMDGLQLLKHIRTTPNLCDLDVMLCTSSTERETILRAAELNVCRYLLKPFNPAAVKEQVREILLRSALKQRKNFTALQQRLGLNATATVEVLRGFGQQLAADVSAIRNALAAGRRHSAGMTLQGLKGSCATMKDPGLVALVEVVLNDLNRNDLSATLEGLERLQAEGKRVWELADKFALLEALGSVPAATGSGHPPPGVAAGV
jgi:CheY-like chemotaxis protein